MFRWRMKIPHVKFFSLNGDFRYQTAKPISSKLKTRSINAQKNQKGFKILNWHSATHVFIIEFWFNQVFPYSQSANKFGRSSNPSNSDLNSVTYDMLHIICIVIHKLHTGILYIHVWNYGNIPRNPSVLGYVIIFWKRPMISTGYRLLNSPHFLDIYVFFKNGSTDGVFEDETSEDKSSNSRSSIIAFWISILHIRRKTFEFFEFLETF